MLLIIPTLESSLSGLFPGIPRSPTVYLVMILSVNFFKCFFRKWTRGILLHTPFLERKGEQTSCSWNQLLG